MNLSNPVISGEKNFTFLSFTASIPRQGVPQCHDVPHKKITSFFFIFLLSNKIALSSCTAEKFCIFIILDISPHYPFGHYFCEWRGIIFLDSFIENSSDYSCSHYLFLSCYPDAGADLINHNDSWLTDSFIFEFFQISCVNTIYCYWFVVVLICSKISDTPIWEFAQTHSV